MSKYNLRGTSVQFQADGEEKTPKFRIVANAGSRMEFWDESVVVNMAGKFRAKKNPLPICYAHNLNEPIGIATNMFVENGELILEGIVLASSDRANLFVETAKKGLSWEASIGFDIRDATYIKKGKKATVNGRDENGPLTIANNIELWECSVVLYGADNKTKSVITASNKTEGEAVETTTVEEKPDIVEKTANDNSDKELIKAELETLRRLRVDENKRIDAIESIARQYECSEFRDKAIEEGWSPDKFELETLRASRSKTPTVQAASRDECSLDAIGAAFIMKAGLEPNERKYNARVLEQAEKLQSRGSDFRDIIEAATGFQPTRAQMNDGAAWIDGVSKYCAGAVTTHSLQSILTTSANAVMLSSFDVWDNAWRSLFKIGSVSDYKAIERWRLSSSMKYKQRFPGGEYENVKWSDEKWEIKAGNYGIQGSIDFIHIKNGEALGVFTDTMKTLGTAAAKTISDKCWELFINPPNIASTAFYSTNFETLKASCPLNFANLSAARVAFIGKKQGNSTDTAKAKNVQKDERLGIAPRIIVVPTGLEDTAMMLTQGSWLNNGSQNNNIADYNPNKGRFKVISSPELEANSSTSWYLMTDPNILAAFEIVFVDGRQAPQLRSQEISIGSVGIEFDANINFGVGAFDYRAIQKMTA